MKKLTTLLMALLFFPTALLGYLVTCAKPGFDTGKEIANGE